MPYALYVIEGEEMPTYDYECTKCGHTFEVFHAVNSSPRKRCPRCEGKIKKLISAGSGLIFKGSGFYITDYKKKDSGNQVSSEKSQSTDKKKQSDKQNQESKTNKNKEKNNESSQAI